jgi:hypothetical protein
MRKNLLVILSVLVMSGMIIFSCGQAAAGDGNSSGTGTTVETQASVKFKRVNASASSTIIMNLYSDLSAAFGAIMPNPAVQIAGETSYYKVTPGSYYVTWTSVGNLHSSLTAFEKGKKYTAALNTTEDAVTITVDP